MQLYLVIVSVNIRHEVGYAISILLFFLNSVKEVVYIHVFGSSGCSSVCHHDYGKKSTGPIFMKRGRRVQHGAEEDWDCLHMARTSDITSKHGGG